MCQVIDTDGGGTLSRRELVDAYDEVAEFRTIVSNFGIKQAELAVVFKMMDRDGNGHVDFTEFVEELYAMVTSTEHTMLVFIKHYVSEIYTSLAKQFADSFQCYVDMQSEGVDDVDCEAKGFRCSASHTPIMEDEFDKNIKHSLSENAVNSIEDRLSNSCVIIKPSLPSIPFDVVEKAPLSDCSDVVMDKLCLQSRTIPPMTPSTVTVRVGSTCECRCITTAAEDPTCPASEFAAFIA